jgi:phosphoadenosine phosphosulfate reductase
MANFEELEKKNAVEIIKWAVDTYGNDVGLACSLSIEDNAILDMLVKIKPDAKIFVLDTGRLHQETYDVLDKINKKYNIKLDVYSPDTASVEKMVKEHGINLFYDSIEFRKLCCSVRKIQPLKRAFKNLKAWICGLRREQSVTRTEIKKVEVDAGNNSIIKINPLADWTEKQVWDYIKANNVPYNALHDKNFPSIGCAPCTRAVKPGEDIRAGRWWWETPEQKECGLHGRKK